MGRQSRLMRPWAVWALLAGTVFAASASGGSLNAVSLLDDSTLVWSEAAPVLVERGEPIGAAVDGKLYVLGGKSNRGRSYIREGEVYDPLTDTWTRLADAPLGFSHSGVAVDGRDIYIAGGVVGTATEEVVPAIRDVWKYNIDEDTWSQVTPLPEPRSAGALVLLGRDLHFFGGTGPDRNTAVGDHWILSLESEDAWRRGASLPLPRNHLTGAALGGKVYAIAGQTGDDQTAVMQADVYAWDPATDIWSAVAPLPGPRSHHATVVYDGQIIVLGGQAAHGRYNKLADVVAYDPLTDAWIPLTPLPQPRHSGIAGIIGDDILYAGGAGGNDSLLRGEFQQGVEAEVGPALQEAEIVDGPLGHRPRVAGSTPANDMTGVPRDTAVALDFSLAEAGRGLEQATLTTSNIQLFRATDNVLVPGTINRTAAGDGIVYQLDDLLEANATYTFQIGRSVTDQSGISVQPFSMTFMTGPQPPTLKPPPTFRKTEVYAGGAVSSIVVSPDGTKLYAGFLDGHVRRWTIDPAGDLTDEESFAGLAGRAITGLSFDPTDPTVLWVSHNAPIFPRPAPDFSGKISQLILHNPGFAATIEDYVVGLPRSGWTHMTNGLTFGPDGMLYVAQGSNTSMGAPTEQWEGRPERLLSASVLRVDPRRTVELPIDVRTEGTDTPYDLTEDAPVTIFAAGTRNAYDLVWHSSGYLYVPTNGGERGVTPASPPGAAPAVPALQNVAAQHDYLNVIAADGGYFGHPNPLRGQYALNGANPTQGVDPAEVVDQVIDGKLYPGYPVGIMPDKDYRGFAWDFGLGRSPNGIIEYRSATFDGALQDKLLVAEYSAGDIVVLTPSADGTIVNAEVLSIPEGLNNPLDLAEDVRNGNLYVVELVQMGRRGATQDGRISLLRPA